MRRLPNQQGLSLVEVTIILAVVSLLLGLSLIPLGTVLQDDAYEAERREMERFHDAIIGYVITHRTRERFVSVVEGSEIPNTLFAERPYLPCPDIDGDGYEDRYRNDSKDNRNFDDIGLTGPPEGITMSSNELLKVGGCVSARGILPWRTLGVRPHDRWGNRYTYEVDEIFSNAMVGFDETMLIDSFDIRKKELISDRKRAYDRREEKDNPIVICGEALANSITSICQSVAVKRSPTVVVAGQVVGAGGLIRYRRNHEEGDVSEGLPYVIVSHGRNGHGAVNHRASSGATIRCRYPANGGPVNVDANKHFYDEAVNFPQIGLLDEKGNKGKWGGCSEIRQGSKPLVNGFFVHKPRYFVYKSDHSEERHYDDIVIWRTVSDLRTELQPYVLPIDPSLVLRPLIHIRTP